MNSFSFITSGKIIFGRNEFSNSVDLISDFGESCLVICTKSITMDSNVSDVLDKLKAKGLRIKTHVIPSEEPSLSSVGDAVTAAKGDIDFVIGIGGGSAVDTAKAVCGIAVNDYAVIDYLEGVGKGLTMINQPLPFIAVPTTSGTGAEVTKNAVISSKELGFKRSFRDERLLANLSIVDPILTVNVPNTTTAYAGMDALTQLIESYISRKSNPLTDSMAIACIGDCAKALVKAYDDGQDVDARETMAYCSMVSGLCLANSGLGAAHGIGAALGAVLGIPHGMACAILLPHVIKINAEYIGEKIFMLAKALTGHAYTLEAEAASACVDAIDILAKRLSIPADLKQFRIDNTKVELLADSCSGSSMGGNPYKMSRDEVIALIQDLI